MHRTHSGTNKYGLEPDLYYNPVRLINHIDAKEMLGQDVAFCPSVSTDLKNTLVFKSPVDIDIDFNEDMSDFNCRKNYPPEFLEYILTPPSEERVLQIRTPMILLFADKDVTATQMPTYLDDTNLNKTTHFISGTFNIGSWLRPFLTAFKLKPYFHRLRVSKGDALNYVKINTNEPFKLVQFDSSDLVKSVDDSPLHYCVELKNTKSNKKIMTLDECYNAFREKDYHNKTLKWIEERVVQQ